MWPDVQDFGIQQEMMNKIKAGPLKDPVRKGGNVYRLLERFLNNISGTEKEMIQAFNDFLRKSNQPERRTSRKQLKALTNQSALAGSAKLMAMLISQGR